MTIEPIILFDMLAAVLILSLGLVGAIFYFAHHTKKHQFHIQDNALNDNSALLEATRIKAVKIIDEANSRALDIVNKVNLSADQASEKFNQEIIRVANEQIQGFQKATSEFSKLYTEILQDLKTKNVEVFQNVSKDIEVNTTEEIKNFKESMEKLTILSQKTVKEKIYTDYDNAKKEIDSYKKEEFKKIDEDIYKLLEKVSKLVLGKALNLSEHEDLVEASLEKAKKEGAFKQ